jgi:diadenosine tetraphosphate (Ap4A) HIT family hydrolase
MNHEQLKIKEFKYWDLYLHQNQCYLGRSVIWLKREGVTDLMELPVEEQTELFVIGKQVKEVLTKLFQPDLFNWASLGNITNHLHLHVIPRYKRVRNFDGTDFIDERWGQNYSPYNKDFILSEKIILEIKNKIASIL